MHAWALEFNGREGLTHAMETILKFKKNRVKNNVGTARILHQELSKDSICNFTSNGFYPNNEENLVRSKKIGFTQNLEKKTIMEESTHIDNYLFANIAN